MARQIRFYTDENVSRAVIDGLRRTGGDVVPAPNAGILGSRMKNISHLGSHAIYYCATFIRS